MPTLTIEINLHPERWFWRRSASRDGVMFLNEGHQQIGIVAQLPDTGKYVWRVEGRHHPNPEKFDTEDACAESLYQELLSL
jgi:hypothetical protein